MSADMAVTEQREETSPVGGGGGAQFACVPWGEGRAELLNTEPGTQEELGLGKWRRLARRWPGEGTADGEEVADARAPKEL